MADYQNRSLTTEHGKVWYIGTTSQVLEPITQSRKTNTPRGPDFSDLANNILGTVKLYVIF